MSDLFAMYLAGTLTPHVGGRFDLDRVGEALRQMAEGATTGKLFIQPT